MEIVKVIPRIIELFDSTCIKQFESMGCKIKQVEQTSGLMGKDEDSSGSVVAFIEAASLDISVKLFLKTPRALLDQTMPRLGDCVDTVASLQEDWNLELANRFLGRLKNKLVDHDCVMKMGLPELCSDSEYRKGSSTNAEKVVRLFLVYRGGSPGGKKGAATVGGEVMECCIYINLLNEFMTLTDHEDEDEDWFAESELEDIV